MSAPTPIFVSPSTTFVQVDPLQSPYNPVVLNSVVYPGQLVTVLDATSSFGVLTTPIVVSTNVSASFQDGSISTLINQPQGFVTAQTVSTNKWTFLNSFPFRNQFLSAGLLNLTTSTLYTALASTMLEVTSSLVVQNLLVTGNFIQSQGITLNTNVSSLGAVEFTSSLAVWDNVFFSSDLTVLGSTFLFSSLQVKGNLTVTSSITTLSSFHVSSLLMAQGSLSTPFLTLQDGLYGTDLYIGSLDSAGSLFVASNLSAKDLNLGGPIQAKTLLADSAKFSTTSLFGTASVNTFTQVSKDISTSGSLGVGGSLFVEGNATVAGDISVGNNVAISGIVTVASNLVTSSLVAISLETLSDYKNASTIAQISTLNVLSNLRAGYMTSESTIVSGYVSSINGFTIQNSLTLFSSFTTTTLSTLSNLSVGQQLHVGGSAELNQNLFLSSFLSTGGFTFVTQSTIVEEGTTLVNKNIQAKGILNVGGTLTINSITLPSSLVAEDFITQALFVGSQARFSSGFLNYSQASSITIGYIPSTEYAFDLSGSLYMQFSGSLSTSYVSTQTYEAVSSLITPNTYIQTKQMGVNIEPQTNQFLCDPLGYFQRSTMIIYSTVSTKTVNISTNLEALFLRGDASLLELNYPKNLSCLELLVTGPSTSVIFNEFDTRTVTIKNSTITGTLSNLGDFYVGSTLTVGSFSIWGNTQTPIYGLPSNILQTYPPSSVVILNDVQFIGDPTETVSRRMLINDDLNPNPYTIGALSVYSTLAVREIQGAFQLNITELRANKVVASNINPAAIAKGGQGAIVYISSGNISTTTGKFFIGENEIPDHRFNTIQPYQSTLIFNSTLFVNREFSSVGIRTQPNYSLDVQTVFTTGITDSQTGTIGGQITFQPLLSTLYYAFVASNASQSNVLFSGNGIGWSNTINLDSNINNQPLNLYSFFSPGIPPESNTQSETLTTQRRFFLGSASNPFFPQTAELLIYFENGPFTIYQPVYANAGPTPTRWRSMATDGSVYIVTGTNDPAIFPPFFSPFFYVGLLSNYSYNMNYVMVSFNQSFTRNYGGYTVAYGGYPQPVWLIGGSEETFGGPAQSIRRSTDRLLWSVIASVYSEIRSIVPIELPYPNSNAFLATGGSNVSLSPDCRDGGVIVSFDQGQTWSQTTISPTILFTGPGTCLATNGRTVVVGGESVDGNTLYSSPIQGSNFTFTVGSGQLFTSKTNSVIWTGTQFIAAGNGGIRTSSDGSNWIDPGILNQEVYSVGYMSNLGTNLQIGPSNAVLAFQNSPDLAIQTLVSSATISYYSDSIMNINNACFFDSNQNMVVPGNVTSITPANTIVANTYSNFITPEGFIANTLSTNRLTLGGYFVGVQTV